jgi:hypothetical protein
MTRSTHRAPSPGEPSLPEYRYGIIIHVDIGLPGARGRRSSGETMITKPYQVTDFITLIEIAARAREGCLLFQGSYCIFRMCFDMAIISAHAPTCTNPHYVQCLTVPVQ